MAASHAVGSACFTKAGLVKPHEHAGREPYNGRAVVRLLSQRQRLCLSPQELKDDRFKSVCT